MAKTKISEYDATAANNTDIDSINIAEGMAPSNVNNAIRELMAHLKDMNIGSTITMLNTTEEDSDGGRVNKIIFKGEQSGGESSTLAEIQASHDGTADDQKGDLIFKTNDGSDNAAPTEAARIDSDRNFLVGQASQDTSQTGFSARANSLSHFCRDTSTTGAGVLLLNKKTGDGNVLVLQKDGTTFGNIGVLNTNNVVVASTSADHAGVQFGTHAITPMEANADADGTIDLGSASGKFKDIYLGGGAYLGGTTSANHLDDYEEGEHEVTLTPSSSGSISVSGSNNDISYTKVGNRVHVTGQVLVSGSSSPVGYIKVSLPFTIKNSGTANTQKRVTGLVNIRYTSLNTDQYHLLGVENESFIRIYRGDSTDIVATSANQFASVPGTGILVLFNFTYPTDS